MLTRNQQQGIIIALTAGFLSVGAQAQTGNPSTISTLTKAKPILVERDPFVNQIRSTKLDSSFSVTKLHPQLINSPVVKTDSNETPTTSESRVVAATPEVLVIPAPDVTISGIVSSGKGRQAIINSTGATRVITTGQKLGDYRVASIGKESVTFSYGDSDTFEISMDK